jgi:RNA polymerase sigma factor (sigma-70 family)
MSVYSNFIESVKNEPPVDIIKYLESLPDNERKRQVEIYRELGIYAPEDDGLFVEGGQQFLQSANQIIKGLGETAEEIGLGSGLREWAGENLAANQQWNTPEDISASSYVGRAIGGALGSTAVTVPAMTADILLGTKGVLTFGTLFASTFGDNVQRNFEAYGDSNPDKVYGLAAAESFVDAGIETLLGTVPMLGKTLKKIPYIAKRSLVENFVKNTEKELGKKAAHKIFVAMAKNGAEEGTEEVLQELNSVFWRTIGNDPNVKLSLSDLGDRALQGFIGGAALGTIGGISDARSTSDTTQNIDTPAEGQDIESELIPEDEISGQVENVQVAAGETQVETPQGQNETILPEDAIPPENAILSEDAILPEDAGNIDIEQQSRIVNTLADVFNLKVKYYDEAGIAPVETEKGTVDGMFDEKTGEILLDRNSPTNLNFLFGHEFKHFIDKQYSDLAQGFDTLVQKNINQEGQAELDEQGGNLQEFSADAFGRFFTDNDFLRQTAERLEQQQQGLGARLLNAVKDFINAIRKKLKHIGTPDAKVLFDNMGEMRNTALDMLAEIKKRQAVQANQTVQTVTPVTNVTADTQTGTATATATTETPATENIQPKKMTVDVNDFLVSFDSQLRKIANQYKNSPVDIDDLIQEARIAIANAYDKYDGNGKATPKTFFSNVAKNAMLNAINKENRRQKKQISTENEIGENLKLEDVLPDETVPASEQGEFDKVSYRENPQEFKARAKTFLASLNPQDRRIMQYHLDGVPPSKIAEKQGVTEKDPRKIKARIKKLNQKMIDDMGIMPHETKNGDVKYHITRKRKQINPIIQDGKVRDNYQDLLENREYTPETIEQWDKKAVDWIDKLGGILPAMDALVGGMRHKDRHVNTLIIRHILESDIADAMPSDDLIKLNEIYIEGGTAWGREGVARRLASMTLDRIERVQALFNKLNEGMEDKKLADLRKRIHDKLGIDILSLDKSILDDKDKLDAVLREYQSAKAGKMDKAYEFWINSILSAPATHIVNTVGNTANALYEYTAKRMGEAALNLLFKRKDAATFGEFKEIWKNFDLKGAIERSKVAFNREMLSPDNKFREYSELSIGGKKGRIIRLPTRSLAFMDELARNIIIPMETAAQAYRSGTAKGLKGDELQAYISEKLNSPNSAEFRNAVDKANELTFKKEPDKFVQQLIAFKSQGGVAGTLLKYFLPFVTAPYNILMQGVRKGPLGIVKTGIETGQIIAGKRSIDSQYIGHVAEQFIAWGTLLMLAGMDDDDDLPFITGSNAPFGSAEQKFKEQNIPPYSVRIGGKYWSYKRIEPLATMLSITADTLQAYRDAKNGRDFKKNFINMYKNISDKTYLDSIGELIRFAEDPEKSFASLGTNFAASWMPNAAKAFIMSADDEVRNNKSYEKGTDYALDMMHVITSKAGITQRLPKVDCFGETITKENAEDANPAWLYIGRFVGQYVKNIDEDDKVKKLILTYNLKSNPDEPYWPDIPRNTFSYQNEKYYFGNKDYHDFCVESGKLAKKQLDNAVRHGLLNVNNPTDADIKLIKKVFTRARKEVKTQFIRKGRFNKQ